MGLKSTCCKKQYAIIGNYDGIDTCEMPMFTSLLLSSFTRGLTKQFLEAWVFDCCGLH